MKKFRRLNQFGMTLIEILIVASLIGAVSISIYGALSMGLKVWQRSRGSAVEQDIAIFFDKITKDLHNTYYFSTLPAEGSQEQFTFPSYVTRMVYLENHQEGAVEQIGLVRYEFKMLDHQVIRREAGYSGALNKNFTKSQIVLDVVDSIHFRYIYVSDGQQLESDHLFETLLASVEVDVSFKDIYGLHEMKKIVDLPLSI